MRRKATGRGQMTHKLVGRKEKATKAFKYIHDTSIDKLIKYYTGMVKRNKTMPEQIEAIRQSYKNLPADIKELLYLNLKNNRTGDAPPPAIREIVTLSIPIYVIMITQFGNAMDKMSASSYANIASFLKDNPEQGKAVMDSFQNTMSWATGVGKLCTALLVLAMVAYFFDVFFVLHRNSRKKKCRLLADIIVMLHDEEESDT